MVQLYIRDLVGSVTRPVKELKGFKKIELKSGESRKVSFKIEPSMLGFYDNDGNFVIENGEFHVFIGPSSKTSNHSSFTLD